MAHRWEALIVFPQGRFTSRYLLIYETTMQLKGHQICVCVFVCVFACVWKAFMSEAQAYTWRVKTAGNRFKWDRWQSLTNSSTTRHPFKVFIISVGAGYWRPSQQKIHQRKQNLALTSPTRVEHFTSHHAYQLRNKSGGKGRRHVNEVFLIITFLFCLQLIVITFHFVHGVYI